MKLKLGIPVINQLQSAPADTTDFSCSLPPTSAFSTIFIHLFFLFLSFCTPYCYTNEDHFHKGSFMSTMCIHIFLFKKEQMTTALINLIKSRKKDIIKETFDVRSLQYTVLH